MCSTHCVLHSLISREVLLLNTGPTLLSKLDLDKNLSRTCAAKMF